MIGKMGGFGLISRRLSNGGLGNVSTLGRLISGIELYLSFLFNR
jgi:hypothetical protein